MDDIKWLFARGGMDHFIKMKDHMYKDLTIEFLSALDIEVTWGPRCQESTFPSSYKGNSYELNLSTPNIMFSFSPSLDLPCHQVPSSLTWMLLGMKFDVIIGTIHVNVRTLLLGMLISGWPNTYAYIGSLLGTTVRMSLDCLSCTSCLIWWMVTGYILGLSKPINCTVQLQVLWERQSLEASSPPLLGLWVLS